MKWNLIAVWLALDNAMLLNFFLSFFFFCIRKYFPFFPTISQNYKSRFIKSHINSKIRRKWNIWHLEKFQRNMPRAKTLQLNGGCIISYIHSCIFTLSSSLYMLEWFTLLFINWDFLLFHDSVFLTGVLLRVFPFHLDNLICWHPPVHSMFSWSF